MADVDRKLGLGLNGRRLAPSTAGRFRKDAKACIRWAVELEQIPTDPWPRQPKGRNRRKANRLAQAVDIRRLPGPERMAQVIAALPTQVQPYAGRTWEVMSAVGYYAGLRPSEVLYLRRQDVHLPEPDPDDPDTVGWGWLEVEQADDGEDNAADPKTGRRVVPIPPHLVVVLQAFLEERPGPPETLLFRTKKGTRPSLDNWRRALRRACRAAGIDPLSPYDLRHACATTWIQAGVPLGEAARRLGHSVQTLVARYIQALTGDETIANHRVEAALGPLVDGSLVQRI
jgi:integrase